MTPNCDDCDDANRLSNVVDAVVVSRPRGLRHVVPTCVPIPPSCHGGTAGEGNNNNLAVQYIPRGSGQGPKLPERCGKCRGITAAVVLVGSSKLCDSLLPCEDCCGERWAIMAERALSCCGLIFFSQKDQSLEKLLPLPPFWKAWLGVRSSDQIKVLARHHYFLDQCSM